jgi:DNA-binding transcriptional LysR family regulator
VAEDRSISAAARRLFLTQQSLSGQIRQLERSLGVALLVRGTKGVTLTAAGRRLAAGAAGPTAALDALVAEVRSTFAVPSR